MSIDNVEAVIGKLQRFAVHDLQAGVQAVLGDVLARQIDGSPGQVNAGDNCSSPGKADQVHAGTAADLQHAFAPIGVKVHQSGQVV